MTEKIKTRIRLNTEEPEFFTPHPSIQKKQKAKAAEPFNTAEEQILRLHQTMGNHEVRRMILSGSIRAKLKIGKPNDKYEQEADHAAHRVMSMDMDTGDKRDASWSTTPLVQTQTIPEAEEEQIPEEEEKEEEPVQTKLMVQRREEEGEEEEGTPPAALEGQLAANRHGGSPLRKETRRLMEPRFNADFSQVRVHNDAAARRMNRDLHSQAFTRGYHIYFGADKYNPGTAAGNRLIAHELAHVLQQGEAAQMTPRGKRTVQPSPNAEQTIQRENEEPGLLTRAWRATGGRLLEMGANLIWNMIEARAPRLVPILREMNQKGILGFLRERLTGALTGVFSRLSADNETVARVLRVFSSLVEQARGIIEPLARGDCGPLFAALERLKETVSGMAGDAWNAVTNFFRPVGEFFSDLWQSFGAPFVQWIREAAGDVWETIQNIGRDIWEWMRPVRQAFSDAWQWVKDLLGIGESEGNDQGGLMQWIRDKASRAWEAIKEVLAPVIRPIQEMVAKVRAILPIDAILNLRDTITGWLDNVSSMADSMNQDEGVVEEQTSLRNDILPGVMRTVRQLRRSIVTAGQWVSTQIGALGNTVRAMFASIRGNSILSSAANLIQWLPDRVTQLTQWAQSTVSRTFGFVGEGLVHLSRYIEPVLDTLQTVAEVVGDVASRLSDLVFGRFWRMIPRCIRDPIKNFVIEHILSHIPIFSQLMELPDLWDRVQSTAMRILRQVFVDGDLLRAAWTFFSQILILFNIPPELVTGIVSKAARAIGSILRDPVGFLINLIRAMVRGFVLFCGNIGTHLLAGVTGWLFGHLRNAGITPPTEISPRSILNLVLQILDITRERIFQRMERHPRIGPQRVRRLRQMANGLTEAWEWFSVLVNEGPGGLWRMLQERLSNLWGQVRDVVIGWITRTVITRATARLATMADPSGIGAAVNTVLTIYQAIQSFFQYFRQMLETINSFLDGVNQIAAGAIESAAGFLERSLARIIPIAIGFLANWVGLGNLGSRIRETVEGIRERVNRAIDWLIERGVRIIDAVLRGVRAVGRAIRRGAQRAVQWWRLRRQFRTRNGESHSIFFRGEGDSADMMVASNQVRRVRNFLRRKSGQVAQERNARKKRRLEEAIRIAREKYNLALMRGRQINRLGDNPPSERLDTLAREQRSAFYVVGDKLSILGIDDEEGQTITSRLTPNSGSGKTELITANPLTPIPGNTRGTSRTDEFIPGWRHLTDANEHSTDPDVREKVFNNWRRMHLIHAELHGPAEAFNMVPANERPNRRAYTSVERFAVDRLRRDHNAILWYETRVSYRPVDSSKPYINDFPLIITMKWGNQSIDEDTNNLEPGPVEKEGTFNVDEPPASSTPAGGTGSTRLRLKNLSRRNMWDRLKNLGVSWHTCMRINNAYIHGGGEDRVSLEDYVRHQYHQRGWDRFIDSDLDKMREVEGRTITTTTGTLVIDTSV